MVGVIGVEVERRVSLTQITNLVEAVQCPTLSNRMLRQSRQVAHFNTLGIYSEIYKAV